MDEQLPKSVASPETSDSQQQDTPPVSTPAEGTAEQPAWHYSADIPKAAPDVSSLPAIEAVEWTASEFIDHDKRATWFLGLAGAAAAAAGVVYLMTQDWVPPVVIVITAALLGVAANRKPSTLKYRIDEKGITIGPKHYPYTQFKSFSVIDEGAIGSIELLPMGRFVPGITLYYPPDQEDRIINTLGSYMPHEDRKRDAIDRFMHRIRF